MRRLFPIKSIQRFITRDKCYTPMRFSLIFTNTMRELKWTSKRLLTTKNENKCKLAVAEPYINKVSNMWKRQKRKKIRGANNLILRQTIDGSFWLKWFCAYKLILIYFIFKLMSSPIIKQQLYKISYEKVKIQPSHGPNLSWLVKPCFLIYTYQVFIIFKKWRNIP